MNSAPCLRSGGGITLSPEVTADLEQVLYCLEDCAGFDEESLAVFSNQTLGKLLEAAIDLQLDKGVAMPHGLRLESYVGPPLKLTISVSATFEASPEVIEGLEPTSFF